MNKRRRYKSKRRRRDRARGGRNLSLDQLANNFVIYLDDEDVAAFVEALLAPPQSNEKLRRLFETRM